MRGCDQASTSIILLQAPLMDASRQDPSSFFFFWDEMSNVLICDYFSSTSRTHIHPVTYSALTALVLVDLDKSRQIYNILASCPWAISCRPFIKHSVLIFFFLTSVEIVDGFVLVIPSNPPQQIPQRVWLEVKLLYIENTNEVNEINPTDQNSFAFISHVRLVKCPLKNVYRW